MNDGIISRNKERLLIFHAQPGGTGVFYVSISKTNINNRTAGAILYRCRNIDKVTPPPVHNGLYQILLAMKYLRSSDEEWTVFANAFNKLIHSNSGVVSLAAMNLPADWKEHLSV